jgi:hypothetical protein
MKVGDLVKVTYHGMNKGKTRLVTKIEVRRSIPSNRMITWAYLLGEKYRVQKDHLEVINASR